MPGRNQLRNSNDLKENGLYETGEMTLRALIWDLSNTVKIAIGALCAPLLGGGPMGHQKKNKKEKKKGALIGQRQLRN